MLSVETRNDIFVPSYLNTLYGTNQLNEQKRNTETILNMEKKTIIISEEANIMKWQLILRSLPLLPSLSSLLPLLITFPPYPLPPAFPPSSAPH